MPPPPPPPSDSGTRSGLINIEIIDRNDLSSLSLAGVVTVGGLSLIIIVMCISVSLYLCVSVSPH